MKSPDRLGSSGAGASSPRSSLIPLLDLRREYVAVAGEISQAWHEALGEMRLLSGPQVAAFEREIADYIGVAHAVGTSCGTDALVLGLFALGIGPGDEVIVQANGFTADVEAIRWLGAQPVLVDVQPDGWGPDPTEVSRAVTARTRALLVVHLYGAPLRVESLLEIARDRNFPLVEDASHAPGAARQGRRVGSFGAIACFSAGVVKNLGAYGDAGYVTTDDAERASQVRLCQHHGQERKNVHVTYGGNYRLDELQAAVLRVKLRHLEVRNQRRREIAAFYSSRFAPRGLRIPVEAPGELHVYHQYVIQMQQRDRLRQHLRDAGIETGVHYPVSLHRQPAWVRAYGAQRPLPRAERLAREVVSLPIFPELTDAEVERIAEAVVTFAHP